MRYFVTGATGWIGSAVVRRLLEQGHDVLGLARSDESAAAVVALGAEPWRGDLTNPDSLAAGAAATDGTVHLAYHHDFTQMAAAADMDGAAISAIGSALEGTGRPLLIASGTLGLAFGRPAVESDRPDPAAHPRGVNALAAMALADHGVRSIVVRFAPTVHGVGDHGFVAILAGIAREHGVSAYVDEGANRWNAVHRDDAADLVCRALDRAPAGSAVHAVAEEGVATRDIAEALGRSLGLPVASVPASEAAEHFGWMGMLFSLDAPASNDATRQLLDWDPAGPTLLADIDAGHYRQG
jgi:nucleoside-diphosphate-sugar epimerase